MDSIRSLHVLALAALGAVIAVALWANYLAKSWASRRRQSQPAQATSEKSLIEPLIDFDWAKAERRQLRPFKPIYHITMAIRADPPSELITIDEDYLDRINLRRGLIAEHGHGVYGCTPAGESAVRELYTYLLTEHLPIRFPTIFSLSGNRFENHVSNKIWPTIPSDGMDAALRVLGQTVEEDLFLLQQTPDGHRCVAFVCCFPSGWEPSAKLDKTLLEIHAPVPSYEKIGASMERFFARLEAGKAVKRTNWSVQTHDSLYNTKGNHVTGDDVVETDAEVDIEKTFLRSELQTLTRLPKTGAILFSFKTYLYPVRQLKEEGLGPAFADAIEGLQKGNAPGMWTYKSAIRWGKETCKYLRS